jgi:hypothetical protein
MPSQKLSASPLHKKRLRVMLFAVVWNVADREADMVVAKNTLQLLTFCIGFNTGFDLVFFAIRACLSCGRD